MKHSDSEIRSPQRKFFLFGIWILVAILALSFWYTRTPSLSAPPELMGVLRPEPKPLVTFELTDQNGKPFTIERLQGKWTFTFFGYTNCPDVCPATMSVLTKIDNELSANHENLQVLFVSVDPERDTPEHLFEYMSYFNKKFTAITGAKKEIDNLAQQYSAGYIKEPETTAGNYLVNHTSAIFLTDPQARLVAAFSQPHNPKTIVEQYVKIRKYIQ